jgi:hypothetical protein
MPKPRTKEQREADARAALRQRVADIAVGAAGYDFKADGEFAAAEFLSRFIPALQVQFGVKNEGNEKNRSSNDYLWKPYNFAHFNDIDSTTDFLFAHQVRA